MSAQPGGLCMSQCAHWRILCFPVPQDWESTKSHSLATSKSTPLRWALIWVLIKPHVYTFSLLLSIQ